MRWFSQLGRVLIRAAPVLRCVLDEETGHGGLRRRLRTLRGAGDRDGGFAARLHLPDLGELPAADTDPFRGRGVRTVRLARRAAGGGHHRRLAGGQRDGSLLRREQVLLAARGGRRGLPRDDQLHRADARVVPGDRSLGSPLQFIAEWEALIESPGGFTRNYMRLQIPLQHGHIDEGSWTHEQS